MKKIIIIVLIIGALSYVIYYITKPPATAEPENDAAYLPSASPPVITPIYNGNNNSTLRTKG